MLKYHCKKKLNSITPQQIKIMKYIFYGMLLIICFGCVNKTAEDSNFGKKQNKIEMLPVQNVWHDLDLDIEVMLNDSIFSSVDSVKIKVKLTNTQNFDQKFIFDLPKHANPIILEIEDELENSMVINHWVNLSSTTWGEADFKNFHYKLKPNQSIEREFYITSIAVIRNPNIKGGTNSILEAGIYSLKLKFGKNSSGILKFKMSS